MDQREANIEIIPRTVRRKSKKCIIILLHRVVRICGWGTLAISGATVRVVCGGVDMT
jgi:hypothetical protein